MLCWAGLVPTLVYANITLEAITQRGFRLTLKLCKEREKRNPVGEIQREKVNFKTNFLNSGFPIPESNGLVPEAPAEQVKSLVSAHISFILKILLL